MQASKQASVSLLLTSSSNPKKSNIQPVIIGKEVNENFLLLLLLLVLSAIMKRNELDDWLLDLTASVHSACVCV